jgi:hypothetical protein
MSGASLETCWAIKEHYNNKLYYMIASCWLFLYDLKEYSTVHSDAENISPNYWQQIIWPHDVIFHRITTRETMKIHKHILSKLVPKLTTNSPLRRLAYRWPEHRGTEHLDGLHVKCLLLKLYCVQWQIFVAAINIWYTAAAVTGKQIKEYRTATEYISMRRAGWSL